MPYTQVLHPSLSVSTHLFGYTDSTAVNFKHLGGLIIATRGRAVRIRFTNKLPSTHILPVDTTIPGAEPARPRTGPRCTSTAGWSPGSVTAAPSTGGPPNGTHGASFLNGPGSVSGQYSRPAHGDRPGRLLLPQRPELPRLVWYHDHALGITRLNAYAGIATGYLIRDDVVATMEANGTIPPLGRLIPLVFQDKIFICQVATPNPDGRRRARRSVVPQRLRSRPVGVGPPGGSVRPCPLAIPEFFGDTMLVNGMVYPYVEVEQRKYRFLMLNACNARFLRLQAGLCRPAADGFPDNTEPVTTPIPPAGPPIVQIATEGGFLPAPVTLTGTAPTTTLLLAPAERAE